ncbi:MAG: cell surface protein [Chlorobi bacterium]|nr:cell surface protein [Chlorobiota bacterium]
MRSSSYRRPGAIPGRLRRLAAAALLFLAIASPGHAQWENTGADAVESFTPGTGAGLGSDHYPENVLGLPDSAARADIPTIDPVQILSLGLGGEIVLRFDRAPITDIPGPDFTVFENAFTYIIGGKEKTYAEPGEVAVSRDGVHFLTFPYDSITLRGCAGVGPTNGGNDPGDPLVSGGNSFDLHDLGVDSVRWVRIRDVTSIVKDHPSHPFWDPTLTGFDLDAVVRATKSHPGGIATAPTGAHASAVLSPNPVAGQGVLRVDAPISGDLTARVTDLLGREVMTISGGAIDRGRNVLPFDASRLADGVYFIAVAIDGHPVTMLRAQVCR